MRSVFRRMGLCALCFMVVACGQASKTTETTVYQYRPQKTSPGVPKLSTVPTVVIDPGHGGFDRGAHSRWCEEKDACLKTGLLLRKHLEAMGYHVIMTRSRDEFIPLKKRAEIANDMKCQALVSLHYNSAPNKTAHGIEIFYANKSDSWRQKRSKMLAQTVLSKLLTHTGAESRGVKEGNFCVIRETRMPSILVEGGFITNDEEEKKLSDERYLNEIAVAIAEGLDQYFRS